MCLRNTNRSIQPSCELQMLQRQQKNINARWIGPSGFYNGRKKIVQVHEDNQVTNAMEARTTGAICLCPSNMNGGYSFDSLETGEILTRRKWTELPGPNDVITRLDQMSMNENDEITEYLMESDQDPDELGDLEYDNHEQNLEETSQNVNKINNIITEEELNTKENLITEQQENRLDIVHEGNS
jgi:hypothetical protein